MRPEHFERDYWGVVTHPNEFSARSLTLQSDSESTPQFNIEHTLLVVQGKHDFERALTESNPKLILCDHSLPNFNSIEAFQLYRDFSKVSGISIPFILVTGNLSEEFAVQSFKAGVDDYILKGGLKRLPVAIKNALERYKIESERAQYFNEAISKKALMTEAEELANFGSWEADLRTGKHTWSDATFSLYGLTPGEIEPDYATFLNHVHPDERAQLKERLENSLIHDREYESEFRIVDAKGQTKHISCKMKIERDEHHAPIRLVGFNLDTTARKEGEAALKRREQEYRSLFDQNPDAVFSLDLDGRFTNVNNGFKELVGLSHEELIGCDFREILSRSHLEGIYHQFLSANDRKPERYETRFVNRLGSAFTLDVTLMSVVVDGQIIGVHCIAKDITERKELETLLDQAYRAARIGGWEVDINAGKLSWTAITRELHEVSPDFDPTIESGINFYKEGWCRQIISEALHDCIEKGIPWDLELQIVTGKGNVRWVRVLGEAEHKDGKCVRLYGTFQDIHEKICGRSIKRCLQGED